VLEGGRDKSERTIANNTKLVRRGPHAIAVRLHRTDVVTFHRDGTASFDTGGWNTSTTRARMNEYAPAGIKFFTRKGTLLYVIGRQWDGEQEFVDGMQYDPRRQRVTLPCAATFLAATRHR
jgi:hypothetical protein